MAKLDSEVIDSVVMRWIRFRKEFQARSGTVKQGDVKEFVARATGLSRELASVLDITNADKMEALSELAGHACVDMRNPKVMEV